MNKYVVIILCAVLIISGLFVGCKNTKKEDSFNISSEELDKLVIENPNAQIIKRYRGGDYLFFETIKTEDGYIFNEYEKIEDVLQSEYTMPPHYLVVVDDKIVSCQALIDGKSKEVTDNNSNADSRDERVIAKIKSGEIVNKISKDINVKSTYYFATPKHGSLVQYVVYLETDRGDFVYVYEADEEMEYIFPSDVFFELKKMEREYWYNETPVLINGYSGPPLGSLKDIERYNINSPSFDLEIK